jgi:hypothetical protein
MMYPTAPEFRALASSDATLLIEFDDSVAGIDDLIVGWRESDAVWDVNTWNVFMQKIHHSVSVGVLAAERFCPSRQYDPTMPASGTLVDRASISSSMMKRALTGHIDRFNARAAAQPKPANTQTRSY